VANNPLLQISSETLLGVLSAPGDGKEVVDCACIMTDHERRLAQTRAGNIADASRKKYAWVSLKNRKIPMPCKGRPRVMYYDRREIARREMKEVPRKNQERDMIVQAVHSPHFF